MRIAFLFVGVVLSTASFATSIAISNHSFEAQTLGSGSFFYSPTQITDWSSTATGGADRGVWNTSALGKDGDNIAFAYANNAFGQQLAATVQADTVYTLQYLMGRTGGGTRGTAELWAGGTLANGVVSGGTLLAAQTLQINQGSMSEFVLTYTSPTTGAVIGQLLTIRFAGSTISNEGYVSFDHARLSAEAVPEPATLTLLALGALAAARRRRK
jgi:hypothetical protein